MLYRFKRWFSTKGWSKMITEKNQYNVPREWNSLISTISYDVIIHQDKNVRDIWNYCQ